MFLTNRSTPQYYCLFNQIKSVAHLANLLWKGCCATVFWRVWHLEALEVLLLWSLPIPLAGLGFELDDLPEIWKLQNFEILDADWNFCCASAEVGFHRDCQSCGCHLGVAAKRPHGIQALVVWDLERHFLGRFVLSPSVVCVPLFLREGQVGEVLANGEISWYWQECGCPTAGNFGLLEEELSEPCEKLWLFPASSSANELSRAWNSKGFVIHGHIQ